MGDLLFRLLGRRPWIIVQGVWAILFLYGLARSLRDREWGYSVFCGVIALLFIFGTVRAIRSEPVRLGEEPGPASPPTKAPPPIEPR